MPAESVPNAADSAAAEARDAAAKARQAVSEGISIAEEVVREILRSAERVAKDAGAAIHSRSRGCSGPAKESLDDARRYLVERVKERPVTATLAGLGLGVLIGVLLSSRAK
jgi:ElaB/YqjD/DUF883 family membrane-anchored ribosome-binding protein